MLVLNCDALMSECTRYVVATTAGDIHLFGTGRDGTSRFYVRLADELTTYTGDPPRARRLVFYGRHGDGGASAVDTADNVGGVVVHGADGAVEFSEFSEQMYRTTVISRELWLVGGLPDFKDCGVCVTHVSATIFLFDLQCVLRIFDTGAATRELVFENDKRDPRRLSLKCTETHIVYPFRVAAATFAPVSRGCVLAVHDVPQRPDAPKIGRCSDSPYRFCARITVGAVHDLCAYLQCAELPDDAELVMTICSTHGTIRVVPAGQLHRSRFEATLVCKSAEVGLVQQTNQSHKRQRDSGL